MHRPLSGALLVAASLMALPACSARTRAALEETRLSGAHFATWSHLEYSVERGTPETTTKGDIQRAQNDQCLPSQSCKWWGEVVQVAPIQ